MKTAKTALIINAHPDDSEMAMGGTLLLLRNAGIKIINASLTRGEAGTAGSKEIREEEFLLAQSKLGSTGILLGFPDTALENTLETRHAVIKLIREHKPDLVFAPYLRNDKASFDAIMNRDHSVSGHIASEAVKLARLKGILPDFPAHKVSQLIFYMLPYGTNPTILVDTTSVHDEMVDLVSSYKSQLQEGKFIDKLITTRVIQGMIGRLEYAEGFISEMPLVLEVNYF